MEHQKIFATNIFLLDDFMPGTGEMKVYIHNLWRERDYDTNWQTKSADLHTKKEFKDFSDLIDNQNFEEFSAILEYDLVTAPLQLKTDIDLPDYSNFFGYTKIL